MRLVAIFLLCACSQSDDVPSPHVAAVTPNRATPGTSIVISGSSFCQQPVMPDDLLACENVGIVLFGVASGQSTQYTDGSISVDVPGGTGTVQVVVSSAGRTSNGVDFTFE